MYNDVIILKARIAAVLPTLNGSVDGLRRDQRPVAHVALEVTDAHRLDVDNNDAHVLARDEAARIGLTVGGGGREEGAAVGVLKRVVLQVLRDVKLLLVGARGGQTRGTSYGGADAGHGGAVEVEEQGGEAGRRRRLRGAAGWASAVRAVGDPCRQELGISVRETGGS